jgi:anti-sigma B factor antagonist
MLEFQREDREEIVVLIVKGNLDALTAPELRPTIDDLVANRKTQVVFDLGDLTLIDSSGVGAIVSLFKRVRLLGGDVKIACLANQPKEIFRLLRLDRAFELYESVEEAAEKFRQQYPGAPKARGPEFAKKR